MLSSMPEKIVIYALQCALCSLLFFALSSVQHQLPAKLVTGMVTSYQQNWYGRSTQE